MPELSLTTKVGMVVLILLMIAAIFVYHKFVQRAEAPSARKQDAERGSKGADAPRAR